MSNATVTFFIYLFKKVIEITFHFWRNNEKKGGIFMKDNSNVNFILSVLPPTSHENKS
jgi:hypothetical protein